MVVKYTNKRVINGTKPNTSGSYESIVNLSYMVSQNSTLFQLIFIIENAKLSL